MKWMVLMLIILMIGNLGEMLITNLNKHAKQPYVVLQTEEALYKGDTLQVIQISPDTIWVGYLN